MAHLRKWQFAIRAMNAYEVHQPPMSERWAAGKTRFEGSKARRKSYRDD
jgi:hypothetical protein